MGSEQAINKNEMAEMIDREMLFDAINKFEIIAAAAITGVADQYIDR